VLNSLGEPIIGIQSAPGTIPELMSLQPMTPIGSPGASTASFSLLDASGRRKVAFDGERLVVNFGKDSTIAEMSSVEAEPLPENINAGQPPGQEPEPKPEEEPPAVPDEPEPEPPFEEPTIVTTLLTKIRPTPEPTPSPEPEDNDPEEPEEPEEPVEPFDDEPFVESEPSEPWALPETSIGSFDEPVAEFGVSGFLDAVKVGAEALGEGIAEVAEWFAIL